MKTTILRMLLVSLSFVMLTSFLACAEPLYVENTTIIPESYDFDVLSVFNMTLANGTENTTVDYVNISLNYSGAQENYTMSLIEGDGYSGVYNYNLYLGAGYYEWSSCAVDNETNVACIGPFNFTINKADPTNGMYIEIQGNNDTTPYLLQYSDPLNLIAWNNNNGGNDCTFDLQRDDAILPTLSDNETLRVGSYIYTYNSSECANYTSSSVLRVLSIIKKTQPISLYLNGVEGNRTNGNSFELYDMLSVEAFLNLTNATVYLNSTYPGFVTTSNNSSTTQNMTFNETNLTSPGLYAITAYWDGNENYSSYSKTYYFGVIPYWTDESTSVSSGSIYSAAKNYSFQTRIVGNVTNVTFETDMLNSSSSNYTNLTVPYVNRSGDLYWINFTGLPAGNYNYRWHAIYEGESVSSSQRSYNVSKIPLTISWINPTTWTVNAGTTVTVQCQANDTINMVLSVQGFAPVNATQTVSTDISSASADEFICSCYPMDASNYSGSITSQLYFQTVSTTTTTTTSSGGGDSTPTGTFLVKDLVSNLSVGIGESITTGFTVSNTLQNNMVDVAISVSGIDSSWYTLSKKTISNLKRYVPETVSITFNIPYDAEQKTYDVTITAKGKELGETSSMTTTKTMKLNVVYAEPKPVQPLNIEGTLETANKQDNGSLAVASSADQNISSNSTFAGPTGLLSTFEYLQNNLIVIVAIASCLLIFMFRENITQTLTSAANVKSVKHSKAKMKMPHIGSILGDYKLEIDLKKEKKTKEEDTPKEDKARRPEVLEREIKRDITELRSILEAEKKMKKTKKKIENN